MIIEFMLRAFILPITAIFNLIPNLPPIPTAVETGGQWLIDQVGGVSPILNMLLTPPLLAATVVVIIALFAFEEIYHATMWVLRKIPLFGIS